MIYFMPPSLGSHPKLNTPPPTHTHHKVLHALPLCLYNSNFTKIVNLSLSTIPWATWVEKCRFPSTFKPNLHQLYTSPMKQLWISLSLHFICLHLDSGPHYLSLNWEVACFLKLYFCLLVTNHKFIYYTS